jgi:hypothetical protein
MGQIFFYRVLALGLLLTVSLPIMASAETPPAKAETPLEKLALSTDAMMKGLDDNQQKQFASITNSHGTIRTVEDVQQSIDRAVKSCAVANADLKETMQVRFEEWKNTIRPPMKEARRKLDKMILLQSFAQPSQVRKYLKEFDAALLYRNKAIKAEPVSSQADCEKLKSSMNDTQNNIVNLLTESLALNQDIQIKE